MIGKLFNKCDQFGKLMFLLVPCIGIALIFTSINDKKELQTFERPVKTLIAKPPPNIPPPKPTKWEYGIWHDSILALTEEQKKQKAEEWGITFNELVAARKKTLKYMKYSPTKKEIEIYNALDRDFSKHPNDPEIECEKRIARRYNIELYELDLIFTKVASHKF